MRLRAVSQIALSAAAVVLVTNPILSPKPATAHFGYFGKTWTSDQSWSFGEVSLVPFSSSTVRTVISRVDDEWNSTSGSWFDFYYTGSKNSTVTWTGSTSTMPAGNWVLTSNLDSYSTSDLGRTFVTFNSSRLTKFVILFDSSRSNWHVSTSSSNPP